MRHIVFGALTAALLGTTLSACGSSVSILPDPTFTVRGTINITGADGDRLTSRDHGLGSSCNGTNDDADIRPGAQVIVRDARETKVAVGTIGSGRMSTYDYDQATGTCAFSFTVRDVPSGDKVYSIAIGHRPDFSFARATATQVSLTLD